MTLRITARAGDSWTGAPYTYDLTRLARRWRRSSIAIGGHWVGSFELSNEDLTSQELAQFYNTHIGYRLEERTTGFVTWEGYIVEMRRYAEGQEHNISLNPNSFHNRVNVQYSSDVGARTPVGWSENTNSSDIFGECNFFISLGGTTATGATALRDRHLLQYAWPRSRIVGGDAREFNRAMLPDILKVRVAGYWSTLNWRYTEASASNARADTLVSNLVGTSEFVTAGRLEENDFAPNTLRYDAYPIPQRTGDLIKQIIEQGDSNANVWRGGVYAGRVLDYEQAPTTWEYQMQGEILADVGSTPVTLERIKPGFLLFNPSGSIGVGLPGATAWDNPKVNYVDEVEFVSGDEFDTLRMHMRDAPAEVSVLARAVRQGTI